MSSRRRRHHTESPTSEDATPAAEDTTSEVEAIEDATGSEAGADVAVSVDEEPAEEIVIAPPTPTIPVSAEAIQRVLEPWFGVGIPSIDIEGVCDAISRGTQVCVLPAPLRVAVLLDASPFVAEDESLDAKPGTKVLLNLNRWWYDAGAAATTAR